ncbi:MAG TPA: ABC transporter ATP-binding protein [Acidobacteriota bacterium]|nr:ABC transporter ATP-binding protein [Acidobacteriota bacterium]
MNTDQKLFQCRGLVKRFPGFQLGPLDLELEPGTVLGFVGPNGSGKSTTINCLAGLLRPEAGEVRILGGVPGAGDDAWKSDLGYVGEVLSFYENWSGEKNLGFLSQFFPNWSRSLEADLARRFRVPLERKVKHLSKGNRVKLALIGVLARSPRLLLLDEPTGGLDPVVRTEVLDTLYGLLESGERSILYSTHILSDIARLVDELAFLVDGRLVLRTSKEDLVTKWRRISFSAADEPPQLAAAVSHQRDGRDHQVISSDHESTLRQLSELGARDVLETRLGIDEIAVHILKGADHVEAA